MLAFQYNSHQFNQEVTKYVILNKYKIKKHNEQI